jgi:hypothetical protein
MALHFHKGSVPKAYFRLRSQIQSIFQSVMFGPCTGMQASFGRGSACAIAFAIALLAQAARAEEAKDSSPKLIKPFECSALAP